VAVAVIVSPVSGAVSFRETVATGALLHTLALMVVVRKCEV